MPPPRMTANPKRPSRYRPGKGQDNSSESESKSDQEQTEQKPQAKRKPAPPPATNKVTGAFQEVNLSGKKPSVSTLQPQDIDEDEFETESEDEVKTHKATGKTARIDSAQEEGDTSQESSGDEEGSSKEDEDSSDSSEDEPPAKLLRPTFIPKNKRTTTTTTTLETTQSDAQAEARRKEKADALIQAQLERNAELKANEKKAWDDSDNEGVVGQTEAEIDDTDGLDPEAERAAWKLRELKRIKRAREQVESAEQEREETERRRNLSKEEREAEDAAHLAAQEEERQGKGKAGFMQRYFHKGAFFQDSVYAGEAGLQSRDIMGSRFADQVNNREVLPEFMQIRDMAKLGRRSRTKYKDLRTEDTGRWGDYGRRDGRPRENGTGGTNGRIDDTLDERFRPDNHRSERTGANTVAVATNRRQERRSPPRHERRNSKDRHRDRSRSPNASNRRPHRSRSRERDRRKRSASPGGYEGGVNSKPSRLDKRVKVD